jgi:hypothetical protein
MILLGLVILIQSVVRMVVMEDEEGKSMGKVKHQLKLFVFSVIEMIVAIQINIISSGLSPSS